MRPERQQLVQDLVSCLAQQSGPSLDCPESSQAGSSRAQALALRRALKAAEQPVRDPPLSLAEVRAKFAELALKHRIGLHGEVSEAVDKVMARLLEVVAAQSEEHRQARREYLDLLVEDRARDPDGQILHTRAPPPAPPIRTENLPELLQLMLLLSARPDSHTRLYAVQLLLGEGAHAEEYLTPAERAEHDQRRAEELLTAPSEDGHISDEDVRGEAEDRAEDSALESDKWSVPESDSEEDWLAPDRPPASEKPHRRDRVATPGPALAEQLLEKMTSWPTDAQPYGWQPKFQLEMDALAQFQDAIKNEETVSTTRQGQVWSADVDDLKQIAIPSAAKLDQVSAMREMIDCLISFRAGVKVPHRGINHMTRLASDSAWDRVEKVRASVEKVQRYAQGLTDPVIVGDNNGPAPPFAAQALGDGLASALQRWDVWLGDQDGYIVSSLMGKEPRVEADGVSSLTLTDFLPRVEARAESLICLASLLTLEEEDCVALADQKMERIDSVSVLNRLHALLGMQRAVTVGDGLSTEPVMRAVEQDLASCYAALVMPYLKEILYWLHLGAPFHWATTQPVLALHLFRPNRTLLASDDAFWTRGWRYASPLDAQESVGDTSALRPAPLILVAEAPEEPDQSVASAAPVLDTKPHVPLFLAPHAEPVLQTGMSVGLLRTFHQADDAQSEATWQAACTNASRRLARAATGQSLDQHEDDAFFPIGSETHALHCLTLGSPRWAGRGLSPPSSPGSSFAGTQPDLEEEDEDVLSVVESVMRASLGLVRLAQKRARDAFILPPPDGSDLTSHLTALHGLMLFRQGDMQVWTDQVFVALDEADSSYSPLTGLAGALDPASLLAALREATLSSPGLPWLDLTGVTFRLLPSPAPTLSSATVVMDPWTVTGGRYSLAHIGRIVPAYHVPWPLTYVITQRDMATYAQSFSLLLTLQWTKRLLAYTGVRPGASDRKQKKEPRLFYALRRKLLWLFTTLMTHFSSVVLAQFVMHVDDALDKATSVAELVDSHRTCVEELHAQLLLPPLDPGTSPPSAGLHWSTRSMDTSQLSFSFGPRSNSAKAPAEAVRTLLSLAVQLVYAHDKYQEAEPSRPTRRRRRSTHSDLGDESGSDADEEGDDDDDLDPPWAEQILQPEPERGQDYETQLQMLDAAFQATLGDLTYGVDRTISRRARMTTAALNDPGAWGSGREKAPRAGAAAILASARDARETMQALATALRGR